MKKIISLFAVAITIVSCGKALEKEELERSGFPEVPVFQEEDTITGEYTITAEIEADESTRVAISDDGIASWQEGDKIALFDTDKAQFVGFTLTDAASGTFTGVAGNYSGLAVSPADYTWTYEGGSLRMELPSSLIYEPGRTMAPMIALEEGGVYAFKPVSGLFKFTFTNVPSGVTEFRFASNKKSAGVFDLGSPNPGTTVAGVANAASDSEKYVTVSIPSGKVTSQMSFYIPAMVTSAYNSYDGFSVSISKAGVPYAMAASAKQWNFERKQMRRLKALDCSEFGSMPGSVYLLGDCFSSDGAQQWNFAYAPQLVKVAPGVYEGTVQLVNAAGGFKIYLGADWNAPCLCLDSVNSTADNLIVVGGEDEIYPSGYGFTEDEYIFTLNIGLGKISIVRSSSPLSLKDKLYRNMKSLVSVGTMFGAQSPTEYGLDIYMNGGVRWVDDGSISHSDTELLAGSHPAVCGWDIGGIELGNSVNLDGESFTVIANHIQAAYRRGAINTISWHCANPWGGNSWNTTPAVYSIIPGGENHEMFKVWLDRVAGFIRGLETDEGDLIPIIFRPWHEHTGAGFWWGAGNTGSSDFAAMWQFTVEYLRDTKGLDNLLFAYSPDAVHFVWDTPGNYRTRYLDFWPGDSYVDVLGLDSYDAPGRNYNTLTPALCQMIAGIAGEKGKIAALTECGLENNNPSHWSDIAGTADYNNQYWWTGMLYPAVHGNGISYALVWRDAGYPSEGSHYFNAFRGSYSASDFLTFTEKEDILLENDLPELYK